MNLRLSFMMHSVLPGEWPYGFLAIKEEELLTLLRFLRGMGFRFIKARDYTQATGRTACLTFDDGFLDNWTLLQPLLEKEGVPFTVFICKDFTENSDQVRSPGLRQPGYLSRGEIRALQAGGLADIQSHTATHTWWPVSQRVCSIFKPGDLARYPWMLWNRDPVRKPGWMWEDESALVGLPVLEHDRALRVRRFILDAERWESFAMRVRDEALSVDAANVLASGQTLGRLETPSEQAARYRAEMRDNGDFLEALLGHRPKVLCWPGGAWNSVSLAIAREEGLLSTASIGHGRHAWYMHRISPLNPYGRARFPWKHQRMTLACYIGRFALRGLLQRVPL